MPGAGVSPSYLYYECGPGCFYWKKGRQLEPKEIPSFFMPRLLVVFTQQLDNHDKAKYLPVILI